MAINALQVAWMSRLADKKIIREGASILEFGPQDLLCARAVVEQYGLRHRDPATVTKILNEAYDGEYPKPILPAGFYSLFGTSRNRYRSLDLLDPRSDWLIDCNEPFTLPERFDVVTNFGTGEHVFNIAALFKSIHDVLKPDGVALHVMPAFGDINHGFYNIHPTTYLDLSAANNYTIEDFCYVDRWDIRNRTFEESIAADFDFDAVPIKMEHLVDRFILQRKVVDLYAANYDDIKTKQYGPAFPGFLYDYCIVALRKNNDEPFRFPVQGYYGGGVAPVSDPKGGSSHKPPSFVHKFMGPLPKLLHRAQRIPPPAAIVKTAVRRLVVPFIPDFIRRPLIRSALKAVLRDLVLDVTGQDLELNGSERWASLIFKRQEYPAPPLDNLTMERMMTIVESRIERLYANSKLTVTINDLDAGFLQNARRALARESNFVSFLGERYQHGEHGETARTCAVHDINGLVSD